MQKIQMQVPIVEMDGDEMTRIIWKMIKENLLEPFVDLKLEYYDLGLPWRDETRDKVTVEAAEAILKYGVGVKCATITPNEQRREEYNLHELYRSPNGTIRQILDGTVFREPIVVKGIEPYVRTWKKPIIIARHAYGDVYKDTETLVPAGTNLFMTLKTGSVTEDLTVHAFDGDGIAECLFNTDQSISSFAHSCFNYALDMRMDLWFATKDTVSKIYDGRFKDIFQRIYDGEYRRQFEDAGIEYFYTLIDDAVARVVRSEGGFIWACKNYDGDVMSDMVATAFGSLAMMTSVLVSPSGAWEYEAAHGTVTRHYRRYLEGEETSTNSMATIFAWSGALKKRGQLDENARLVQFGENLERASIDTIEAGTMTKDLALLSTLPDKNVVDTEGFIQAVRGKLEEMCGQEV